MATIWWLGTTSDITADANFIGGTKPANGESWGVDGRATGPMGGADISGDGNTYGDFIVDESCTVAIGGSGNNVKMLMDGTLRHFGSGAEMYWENSGTTATAYVGPNSTSDNAAQLDGTFTRLFCERGKIQLQASATVTNLFSAPGVNRVVIPSGVTGTNMIIQSGTVESAVNWTLVQQLGGDFFPSAGTITDLYGTNGQTAPTGAVTITDLYAGGSYIFDGSKTGAWSGTNAYVIGSARIMQPSQQFTNTYESWARQA